MIYNDYDENILSDYLCNYDLEIVFDNDGLNENFNGELVDDSENKIKINFGSDGLKTYKHGLRCKVISINGKRNEYEFPVNDNTGVVTCKSEYTKNGNFGRALAKVIAGFVSENLDSIKRYNGYRDSNDKLVPADISAKNDIIKGIRQFNSKSPAEKRAIKNKGKVNYKK